MPIVLTPASESLLVMAGQVRRPKHGMKKFWHIAPRQQTVPGDVVGRPRGTLHVGSHGTDFTSFEFGFKG